MAVPSSAATNVRSSTSSSDEIPTPLLSSLLDASTPTLVGFAALLLVGSIGFRVVETSSAIDSVYAAVGIVTGVGIVVPPSSWAARLWTVALNWSSMAVGGLATRRFISGTKSRSQIVPPVARGSVSLLALRCLLVSCRHAACFRSHCFSLT